MRNFKSNTQDRSRSRGSFRDNRISGGFNNMHNSTCNKCGNKCQVPFKPTGSKPVYCDSCFKQSNWLNQDRVSMSEPSSEQFNQINAKLDKILEVIESLEMEDEDELEEEIENEDKNDKYNKGGKK